MSPRIHTLLSLSSLYVLAAFAGWVFAALGIPLPWMIGPLVLSATLSISGLLKVTVPVKTRPLGQMTIAAQVGLAFTPAALAALLTLAPVMIGTALASAACAGALAMIMARTTGMRPSQAFLSTFPTSPVEAAIMAERRPPDRMLIEVRADNADALAFYAAKDFVEIDRRPRYYSDGSDAVILRRSLGLGCGGRRG